MQHRAKSIEFAKKIPKLLPKSRVTFDVQPPCSTFKALFIGTAIGSKLKRMSLTADVPKGLRNTDAEGGAAYWATEFPMHFIPEVDPVQDGLKKSPTSVKIVNPKTKNLQNVETWSGGTREQFLLHVNKSLSTITQLNLFVNYQKALDIAREKKPRSKGAQGRRSAGPGR